MSAVSLGRSSTVLASADYSLSEVSIPATWESLAPHRHEKAQLYLVLEGEYSESARGREFSLGPGAALFRPANETHANGFRGTEVHGILIEFEPAAARALLPGLPLDAPAYFPAHVLDRLCGAIDRETRHGDPESSTALRGLSLCLAAEVSRLGRDSREEASAPPWLLDAEALLRNRSAEDLRLGKLASILGVPPVRLAAAFRRRFHCSVGDYLVLTRLAHARRMLVESCAPVAEIAQGCGFFDQSHFCRVFKKQHGMSPGAFRRGRV